MTDTFRLATRGSDLAMRQAAGVQEALAGVRGDVELVEVETRGDQIRDELIHRLGKTGAFSRALDEQVLDGDVDAAVHSMKDMPTEFPEGLVVAGVPDRAPAGDVLVTRDGVDLDELPSGAVVGTSSLRRKAQLLRERPDLQVEPLRGNVDTRVQKLHAPALQREHERRVAAAADDESDRLHEKYDLDPDAPVGDDDGDEAEYDRTPEEWFDDLDVLQQRALERDVDTEFDAIVLAEAGLVRSGLDHKVEMSRLPRSEFVPAPGQGAIAITAADEAAIERVQRLDHMPTRVATTVERTILGELGGGCVAPIGVTALLQGDVVQTRVQVLSTDGSEAVVKNRDLPADRHGRAAAEFAADLREAGAADLIEEAKREAGAQ